MKPESDVTLRISELKERVRVLEELKGEELKKPYRNRDYRLLRFLNKEHSVYIFSISQIEWVLSS